MIMALDSWLWALDSRLWALDLFSVDVSGSHRQRQIAEIDTEQGGRPQTVAGTRAGFGATDDPRSFTAMPAAMSAITALM